MADRRPRLLFVVNNAAFFLSHRACLAEAARREGWEVHVATPASPDARSIVAAGFHFHRIRMDRGSWNPLSGFVTLVSLARLFVSVRPDIAHLVTIKPVLLGGLAARLVRVPGVVHAIPGLGWVFLARSLGRRLIRRAVVFGYSVALRHQNARTIFQNTDDRAEFLARGLLDRARSVLIRGSGVDLKVFRPTPEPAGPPVVVLPARMLWDKGVGDFVEAARLLRGRGVRFVLAGDRDAANPAAIDVATLQKWHRDGDIEWWGHCNDMPSVLRASQVICLPSYYREGLPKALLEAAAAARPVITTDAPGCREAVVDGQTGLLVPARDPEALAAALETLLADSALRRRMGEAGRLLAENCFGVESVARQTLQVYDSLLPASTASVRASIASTPKCMTIR